MEERIPTNRSREGRKYKSFERVRDSSGRFKKSKEIGLYVDFKLHYTAKYDTNKFLDLLTHVAVNHDFTENGSKPFRFVMKENTPSADTLLYHIKKFSVDELKKSFMKAFEEIFTIAKKNDVFKKKN